MTLAWTEGRTACLDMDTGSMVGPRVRVGEGPGPTPAPAPLGPDPASGAAPVPSTGAAKWGGRLYLGGGEGGGGGGGGDRRGRVELSGGMQMLGEGSCKRRVGGGEGACACR